jgi:hypothetical protein
MPGGPAKTKAKEGGGAAPKTNSGTLTERDINDFQASYDKFEQAPFFVDIYEVRRDLGWAREKFDNTIARLREDGVIHLYVGDSTTMAKDQREDGWVDKNGTLMQSMTWDSAKRKGSKKS